LAGERAFQDGDAGISSQKLVHKVKVKMCYTAWLVVGVSSLEATLSDWGASHEPGSTTATLVG
jgi:hypothetical protein